MSQTDLAALDLSSSRGVETSSRAVRMAATAVILLFVFGIVFELTARVEDYLRWGMPILSPYRSQSDLIVRDADGMHGRPGAQFNKWVMNDLGLRGPPARAEKGAGVYRIVTVGASETFGLYESPGREYPRQLEDSLEQMRKDGRCACPHISRFEVLNGALLGMSLPTVEQDVRTRIGRLSPDMVVHYTTPAMYLWEEPPKAARPDSSGASLEPSLADYLYPRTLERLRTQAKLLLPAFAQTWLREREAARAARNRPPGWQFTEPPDDRLALYAADLGKFVAAARAIGARPVIATHANTFAPNQPRDHDRLQMWLKFYPRATGNTLIAFDSTARLLTLRVAAAQGVAVADIQARIHSNPKLRDAFADFSHFTDAGAALVAGEMARQFIELVRVPAPSTAPGG